jgi:hypothetical protein
MKLQEYKFELSIDTINISKLYIFILNVSTFMAITFRRNVCTHRSLH